MPLMLVERGRLLDQGVEELIQGTFPVPQEEGCQPSHAELFALPPRFNQTVTAQYE